MDMPGGSGGRRDNYHDNRDNHNNWNRHENNYHSSRGRNYDRNNRDRSRSRDRYDLMDEVNRREREKVFAKGRSYSSRPASFKSSMNESSAHAPDNDGHRRGSNHLNNRDDYHGRDYKQQQNGRSTSSNDTNQDTAQQSQKQKSPGELAAIKEKKRKLMAKYG